MFRDIYISKLMTLEMQVKIMTYNIRSGAIRWQMHDFLSDGNRNVCSISYRIRDIRKLRKMQKL